MNRNTKKPGIGQTPPFDCLRAYMQAGERRADLVRIRRLAQRNGWLKQSVARLAGARCATPAVQGMAWWKVVLRGSVRR